MNIGMLWFDNDPKTPLVTKIQKAANFYQRKHGTVPNLCFVNPSMLHVRQDDQPVMPDGSIIELRTSRSVLPNHFWIGVEQKEVAEP